MRVYRTEHVTHFTVLPNAMLQRHDLSFAALGILAYLLSLPDANDMTVAKLEKSRKEGKAIVRAAVAELRAAGYYIKEDRQDDKGRVRGWSAVYDLPQTFSQVVPTADIPPVGHPPVGEPHAGFSAVNPVKETPAKETNPLPVVEETPARAAVIAVEATTREGEGSESLEDKRAACMPLLVRVGQAEPRLRVGLREAGPILALMADWRDRGASDREIIAAVTAGLPSEIRSAAKLIAHRLTDKMPIRLDAPTVAALPPLVDCPGCDKPFRGDGLCAPCRAAASVENLDQADDSAHHSIAADLRRRMGWRMAS
ncbi:hypothetical protein [Nonomuraea roseola]|uniref:Helix-turn-helix domain-containing protein n=1 Tax=Nonomuraea roseola TaxID=46179 RepID=A0ABV5Q1C1_9ACTN